MKRSVIGILAHVDAGKTTLAESMLYLTGSIRKLGRVDHKDAFLDTNHIERARGITIFSKQARLLYQDLEITLMDTPGHVDFSSEMERTLQVLDYAILVISASDGIQGHTVTLWRLLVRYKIPVFLFINKMDRDGTDQNKLMNEFKNLLHEGCMDFSDNQNSELMMENLAMCDEYLLEQYIERGRIEDGEIAELIAHRRVFPCYFGSALKLEGIESLLKGLVQYIRIKDYPKEFGAKIYKISRDDQGRRLTHMKITGGSLKVKMPLTNRKENRQADEDMIWEEKSDQIRIYSGAKYETVDEAEAGMVCAVTGLDKTFPGEGLGLEERSNLPILEPVLSYQMILPPECDTHKMLIQLSQLEEEDPLLHIVWSEQLKEIQVQLMGEVQTEILKKLIMDRFGVNIEFGMGNIVYKETIENQVAGVGHYEPLRHYAEVHLLLEPAEPGTGLIIASNCSEDVLDRSWQHLVLNHLKEKEHIGILTGFPITDMRITLIAGRAHQKHTEGGDFRQATYRAVRQGLMKARNRLLEPFYNYRLELPSQYVGRAMSDIQRMSGSFHTPLIEGEMSVISGCVPVATMMGYQTELTAYSKGRGRILCEFAGFQPCHNQEEVINRIQYQCDRDTENPSGSVFCAHGAGFLVAWDKVEDYMHVETGWQPEGPEKSAKAEARQELSKPRSNNRDSWQEDKELEAIFTRTYGPIKHKLDDSGSRLGYEKTSSIEEDKKKQDLVNRQSEKRKEYLLVDGYNIIFSWDELNELARENMDAARYRLMEILCNYQGYQQCTLILVFDAYKVKGGAESALDYHNIHVVYTKEAETADQYIEKVTHEITKKNHRVTVATSDALEQLIIMGQGAIRLSARDLKEEVLRTNHQIRRDYLDKLPSRRSYIGEHFNEEIRGILYEE